MSQSTPPLTELTEAHKALFPGYLETWGAYGAEGRPANRKRAEAGIRKAFELTGQTAPPHITWCASPFSAVSGIVELKDAASMLKLRSRSVVRNSPSRKKIRPEIMWAIQQAFGVKGPVKDPSTLAKTLVIRPDENPSREGFSQTLGEACYGQDDSNWLCFYKFFREEMNYIDDTDEIMGLFEIAQSCGWWWPYRLVDDSGTTATFVFAAERHSVLKHNQEDRLHCEDGPAMFFAGDGSGVWAINGVFLPRYIVEEPETITVKQIQKEENAEVRRVMLERFGPDRYIQEAGAQEIGRDDFGILYRIEIPDDEPLVMVKVINSTAEPRPDKDGNMVFKDYWLRVPDTFTVPQEAIAWTFEKENTPEGYNPVLET